MPGLNLAYAAFRRVEVVQHLAGRIWREHFFLHNTSCTFF